MKLYAVRNKEGKFFKNKGYGGYGPTWREKLEDAKFYSKIGQAKSRVTFFFNAYPEYGCPEILEFDLEVAAAKIINMEQATQKSIQNIKKKELVRKMGSLKRQLEYDLGVKDRLEKEIKEVKDQIKNL